MNCELVILPKGGILGKKVYETEFGGVNDEEYKRLVSDRIGILNQKYNEIPKNLSNVQISSITSLINSINISKDLTEYIIELNNSRVMLLNKLYPKQNSIKNNSNNTENRIIPLIEELIIYLNSLNNTVKNSESEFTLKNRIFPVGFYDEIILETIQRQNKNQLRKIYPLYILYNSQLGIFFTPLDVIKQNVAVIPEVIMIGGTLSKEQLEIQAKKLKELLELRNRLTDLKKKNPKQQNNRNLEIKLKMNYSLKLKELEILKELSELRNRLTDLKKKNPKQQNNQKQENELQKYYNLKFSKHF
jgi:hypothetical protein